MQEKQKINQYHHTLPESTVKVRSWYYWRWEERYLVYQDMLNRGKPFSILDRRTMCYVLSCFSCVRLFAIPWTVARQAPLSMGILQARILEWVIMPSSRGSSQPRDQTQVSLIAGGFFTAWASSILEEEILDWVSTDSNNGE